MKKVFVVTVNYNKNASTDRLLKSLEKVKDADLDLYIIIVDNGTKKEFSLKNKKAKTILIRPGINTGFSGGSNIGIKEALKNGADYVLLINNDTVIDQNLVKKLLTGIESDDNIGIAVPKIYFEKGHEFHKDRYQKKDLGRVIWFAGGYIDLNNAKSVHRGVDEVDHGQYDKVEKVGFATGCCMLIKSSIFKDVGYFDERYFLYYEDADLCMKVRNSGHEICYIPDAFLYHENASSSGSGSFLHDYFLTRNQMLFGIDHAPLRTKIALIKQSINLLRTGREYQKLGIKDFYLRRFEKGTYFNK